MTETAQKATGPVKKGGTMFPRISLKDAIPFAIKLVSKTHVSPQPRNIMFPGVFGSNSTNAEIKASALKQFGLLAGKSDAYTASDLAKKIAAAPETERPPLYAIACLNPRVFKMLHQTFQGDKVAVSKIAQQAASAEVHPDVLEQCATLFSESAAFAQLGTLEGDLLELSGVNGETVSLSLEDPKESGEENAPSLDANREGREKLPEANEKRATENFHVPAQGRASINVNVTLDSTLDIEKLERQLQLLRKYGAI